MHLYQELLKLLNEQNQEGIKDALLKKHTHINKEVLDKLSLSSDGKLVFDGQIIEPPKEMDLSPYMEKSIFESELNPGSVKEADTAAKIKSVELAQPLSYYGKNKEGEIGFHYFPITDNGSAGAGIEQRVILDAKMNQSYIVESKNDLSEGMAIVQAYKFVQGEQDVIKTVKAFNNSEKENFYYDESNISFNETGCAIRNEFDVDVTLNDVLYETSFINKREFHKMKFNKKEEV